MGKKEQFRKWVLRYWFMRLHFLRILPMGFISGMHVRQLTDEQAQVSIPYKWLNKNPFQSMYFACLAMAGELSTGILGMLHTADKKPSVSMLVVKLESTFSKKSLGVITFTCKDGMAIEKAVSQTMETGVGLKVPTTTIGVDEAGDEVARFLITWSFKRRSK